MNFFPLIRSPFFTDEFNKALKKFESDNEASLNDYVFSDLPLLKEAQVYSVFNFKLDEETKTYKVTLNVAKNTPVGNIKIDVVRDDDSDDAYITIHTETKDDFGKCATVTTETLPKDLDPDTLKASVKAGVVTITAEQVVPEVKEKEEPVAGDEKEYEIEINL